jgi:flagellar biosynthesis protein FlhF
MKLKSYFSTSVEAAVEQARKELGDEALLVHARPTTPESRYLGAYEVVFGLGPIPQPAAPAATPPHLSHELADLRRQVDRLTRSFEAPSPQGSELDTALAEKIARGTPLTELFSTDPHLGRWGNSHSVAALVGPPGAGKTTTLIKLAARYGIAARRPVQILSADVQRIAAADQLRSMCLLLGIGCEVAETPVALAQLLDEYRGKSLVLIDTPGFAAREMDDAADLADLLASRSEIDTHLVLPASLKPSDLRRTAQRFEMFQPSKLLFTRLDETSRFGALVSESARRQWPISFLTSGQQIPDDLEEATTERLTTLVLGEESQPAPALQRMGAAA